MFGNHCAPTRDWIPPDLVTTLHIPVEVEARCPQFAYDVTVAEPRKAVPLLRHLYRHLYGQVLWRLPSESGRQRITVLDV